MTRRGLRRSTMNSSVPTIIVDARMASLTRTATTRTTSTSPTTRTNRSDNRSSGTVSSLGSIAPDAHFMAALRLAADRKVLRPPGSSRRRPPVPPPKPLTSSLQASRIASRITTRRCLSREPQSDGLARVETVRQTCKHVCRHSNSPEPSSRPVMTQDPAAAVRVSRSKPIYCDVDNLNSEFTKNKDHHSSVAGSGKAIPLDDWPLLHTAAQEMLTEMTQQSAAKPRRLSNADLREAIQLLLEKRAREQQQGELQKQKQPPMGSVGGVRPRRMAAQREVEMDCGFGDCVKDEESGGGEKKSRSLLLIVCIATAGGDTAQSLEETVGNQEQPASKLKVLEVEKLKVQLSHFEPSMVLEAAEENSDSPVHAKLDVVDDNDGLSLPGVELWRDSSSCVHNADVLEAQTPVLTESLAVATQAEPKPAQPKTQASNLLIGMSLRESLSLDPDRMRHTQRDSMKEQRQLETSSDEEKMRVLQQELMEEWKEQKALDSEEDVASADGSDEGGFNSEGSVHSSDKSSEDGDEIEGGTEINAKTNSTLSIMSKDSSFFRKQNEAPVEFTQDDFLGQGIGPDGQVSPAGSSRLGNAEALMERRRELLQRLSKIQMPVVSCPAAVIGHLEDHAEQTELAKELVMNLQPADEQQVVVQTARLAWQNLNLKRPLRLNQYRRCSEDNEMDTKSEDSFKH